MYIKFDEKDIIYNRLKTYPKQNFFIYDRQIYRNNTPPIVGSYVSNVCHINTGQISLGEENVDRSNDQLIYPFVCKDSNLSGFKNVSVDDFHSEYSYGDVIQGIYPLYIGIERDYYLSNQERPKVTALQNSLLNYQKYSPHYALSSSLGDKSTQSMGVISIPTLFYGSSIRKGSVNLKFYISGTLVGELQDWRKNGQLVQVGPWGSVNSGSTAGVVLYNEGFILLTGSWDLSNGNHTEPYVPGAAATFPTWKYFASTGSTGALENLPSSSFNMYFEGINYVNTITMFCRAEKGEINTSQNLTFVEYDQDKTPLSSSFEYKEKDDLLIKNIVKKPYNIISPLFEKTVFINKINIYDEKKQLIAVAKLATPHRKREKDALCYKLCMDF